LIIGWTKKKDILSSALLYFSYIIIIYHIHFHNYCRVMESREQTTLCNRRFYTWCVHITCKRWDTHLVLRNDICTITFWQFLKQLSYTHMWFYSLSSSFSLLLLSNKKREKVVVIQISLLFGLIYNKKYTWSLFINKKIHLVTIYKQKYILGHFEFGKDLANQISIFNQRIEAFDLFFFFWIKGIWLVLKQEIYQEYVTYYRYNALSCCVKA